MKKLKNARFSNVNLNWKVFKNSTQFYKRVKTPLTFTQAENVRRTTENMIKLEVIEETQRDRVAAALTRLILSNNDVRSNLREIAASIARTSDDKTRARNARKLLAQAKIRA